MDFKSIEGLIDDKKYSDAEHQLVAIIKNKDSSARDISIANYLSGYIHTCWDYKERCSSRARNFLLDSIDSPYPIPYGFYLYASVEKDENTAANYLRKGLERFPNDQHIYRGILRYSPKTERLKAVNEILEKQLDDYHLIIDAIQALVSYELWADVDRLILQLANKDGLSDYIKNYLQLLTGYSKLLSRDTGKVSEALDLFEALVENDVRNYLRYSHHMGAIGCAIILKDNAKLKYYFDKLPVNNSINDLTDGPNCIVYIDFCNIYSSIFDELSKVFLDDKPRKDKNNCLKALYLYSAFNIFGSIRFTRKHINDLKRYYKRNNDNISVGSAIFEMNCALKLYMNAYFTCMDMLSHYQNLRDGYLSASTVIEECSDQELDAIIVDVCRKLDAHFEMDLSLLVTEIVDPIVTRLWDTPPRNYRKIVDIPDKISIPLLGKSNKLFEIAYSFSECNSAKGKILYQMLLEKEPKNSSALNNLGVIFEQAGDLLKAEKYFLGAREIDEAQDLYGRNLKRVRTALAKYTASLKKVKNETAWFVGRLNMFYEAADETGQIQCTSRNRSGILKVSPEKADEVFEKMLGNGYIERVSKGDYQTPATYKINPLIRAFLDEKRSRIESNREYERISERINIDAIEDIGYTDELVKLLDGIHDTEFREILNRDLRECAICVLLEQSKSAIIVCGSIIEALLMNKILERGIGKYDIGGLLKTASKMKKVTDMDINELLFVADSEKLIKKEHFHLSHFARSYRNIIHPACEIRKGSKVSKDDAAFMWDILLRIMKAILC